MTDVLFYTVCILCLLISFCLRRVARDNRRLRDALIVAKAEHALTFALLKSGNRALYRLACEHYGDGPTAMAELHERRKPRN